MPMASEDDIKGIVACAVFGGGLLWTAIKNHRMKRKVADTPRSKASSAPQGYVELEGLAWPKSKTIASGEGKEAVYYCLLIQRKVKRGKSHEWVTVHKEVHGEVFFLVDPTGLVEIDPQEAELNTNSTNTRAWTSLKKSEQERIHNIVTNKVPNFPPSTLSKIVGSPYRVVETEILMGGPVYASGEFHGFNDGPAPTQLRGLTEFSSRVFDDTTRARKNLTRFFDRNADGKLCEDENLAGYTMAAKSARLKTATEERSFEVHGFLAKGQGHSLFLADAFEEHLAQRLDSYLWLRFGAGAALVALAIVWSLGKIGLVDFKKTDARQPASMRPK